MERTIFITDSSNCDLIIFTEKITHITTDVENNLVNIHLVCGSVVKCNNEITDFKNLFFNKIKQLII